MTLEHWKYDAGSDSVASLVIPAALGRTRTFDLDYHCRLTVEADADCRVRARASCKGSRVLSLVLEARETLD